MKRSFLVGGSTVFFGLVVSCLVFFIPESSQAESASNELNVPPKGFQALFNGKDLTGWKGLVESPPKREKMSPQELSQAQEQANKEMREHWKAEDGILVFDGKGGSICTAKDYTDFEMLVDWKILPDGDSGIYLRGSPQVQIWDINKHPEGSGGLYNNKINPNKPLECADNPVGQWNTFHIIMTGERVTVYLNGKLVVDGVVMENYWERDKPIYPTGQIELQNHGNTLYFRNIFIKELEPAEPIFNGKNLDGWELVGGPKDAWTAENGEMRCVGGRGSGWIRTKKEYRDFELTLEYKIGEAGNSGVFLRTPLEGKPAYAGMEIQVLDDYAEKFKNLKPYQFTGGLYGVQAPLRQATKKAGEWQRMDILCVGRKLKIWLNGVQVQDVNLDAYPDKVKEHPGLTRSKGYIGLQNHNDPLEFRNIKVRVIKSANDCSN